VCGKELWWRRSNHCLYFQVWHCFLLANVFLIYTCCHNIIIIYSKFNPTFVLIILLSRILDELSSSPIWVLKLQFNFIWEGNTWKIFQTLSSILSSCQLIKIKIGGERLFIYFKKASRLCCHFEYTIIIPWDLMIYGQYLDR